MRIFYCLLGVWTYASLANAQTYSPQSIKTSIGTVSQTVSTLSVKDSSGTQRDSSKYMGFIPASSGYVGDLSIKVAGSNISSLDFIVNYRGDRKRTKEWIFQLYNNSTGQYDKVGDNTAAASWSWSNLAFSVASASRYVNSQGVILLR